MLLRNHKRDNRKDGKLVKPCIGPYMVTTISSKNNCSLKNVNDLVLKKKYNVTSLFFYKEKTLNNDNIQEEINNNFSNNNNVKSEPIFNNDESSNADGITQHGNSMNVSNERIPKCASFDMRK